jgi:hypothetical protein
MAFNNEVKDARGRSLGFRCFTCGNVYPSMWGEVCNLCQAAWRYKRATPAQEGAKE